MKFDNEKIITAMNKSYNEDISKFGCGIGAVKYADQQTQYFRFEELIKNLNLNSPNKTLLDLGCGNSELYRYLHFRGFRGKYIGFDINENLLSQAKEKYSNIEVYQKDILTDKIEHKFDYVLISGLFNCDCGQNKEWVYEFIAKAIELTDEVFSFNAISTYVNYKTEGMFYLDPCEMLDFCIKNLSRRVTLAHHNLPYNYTVQVFKTEDWARIS